MTGAFLYELYQTFMLDQGCETDDFEDLDEIGQNAWKELADYIAERVI